MRALSLVLVLASSIAEAQIVNVQPLVAKSEMRPGFALAIEGALDYRSGNVDLLLASGNLVARYRHRQHHIFLLSHGELGIKSGTRFLGKDLEHLRYRYSLPIPVDIESYVQHDRDEFRRVALRAVAGTGLRLRVIMTHTVEAAVAAAYMIEYQQIRDDGLPDGGTDRLMHRVSAYAMVTVRVSPRLSLGQTVYYQPRIGLPSDLRVLSESALLTTLTHYASLKLAASLAFDTVPPIGVVPLDTATRVALQIAF